MLLLSTFSHALGTFALFMLPNRPFKVTSLLRHLVPSYLLVVQVSTPKGQQISQLNIGGCRAPAPIFPFQRQDILVLTRGAKWSEPPLHRARGPPTPTLRAVADCQTESCVCARVYVCGQTVAHGCINVKLANT